MSLFPENQKAIRRNSDALGLEARGPHRLARPAGEYLQHGVGGAVGEHDVWVLAPLAISVAVLVILGLTLPGPVAILLTRAASIVAGS